ncbi:Uma2 family endonuclease [Caenispirillum salinarum]|uniref:Uma2 family endonuclease n=1 Tax=Caenispirillum salinarum TaxID=859058 RepID=UPI001360B02C|nr:Uma2 family endonuclease [Caenispirillum salinarum]
MDGTDRRRHPDNLDFGGAMDADEFAARYSTENHVLLIDGAVVGRPPVSDEHAILVATLAELTGAALRNSPVKCRPAIGTGLVIPGSNQGLENDSYLCPDLQVQCLGSGGQRVPVLVVEVLPTAGIDRMMSSKIRAYKSIASISDIVVLNPDMMSAVHHRRRSGIWAVAVLLGGGAAISLEKWAISITLQRIYADLHI